MWLREVSASLRKMELLPWLVHAALNPRILRGIQPIPPRTPDFRSNSGQRRVLRA